MRKTDRINLIEDNLSLNIREKFLIQLSKELSVFSKHNFVHGDLNQKNIKLTNIGYVVLDFEPLLIIIKNKVKLFMCTFPYVCKEDLNENTITYKTDKLSFDFFCKKKLNLLTEKKLTIDYVNDLYEETNLNYKVTFEEIVMNNINLLSLK